MKIKISLVSLLLAFAMYSFAQEPITRSDVAGVNTSFDAQAQKTWNNWFIQLGGGAQMFMGEGFKTDNLTSNIGDKISYPALNFSIGRWFAPYWGFRIKGEDAGMFVKDFALKDFSIANGMDDFTLSSRMKYLNVHLDAMWNMSQYFGKYNAKRFFSFIPYAGIGWYMRDKIDPATSPLAALVGADVPDAVNGVTMNGGFLFNFRLSNHVGLHIDLAGTLIPDDKVNYFVGGKADAIASLTAGFTFNLGKTYFEVVQPMDQGLINDLNSKINDLRNENDLLSKRPVSCPQCPQCPPVQTVQAPVNTVTTTTSDWKNVVLFRIGSAVVDANQRINIYNTAQFVKNSGEKVKVVGYADKQTGSAAYNLRLSEKRAKAVAQELTSKFGIASDKIVVEWKGDAEQPFKESAWNRVVIMSAK